MIKKNEINFIYGAYHLWAIKLLMDSNKKKTVTKGCELKRCEPDPIDSDSDSELKESKTKLKMESKPKTESKPKLKPKPKGDSDLEEVDISDSCVHCKPKKKSKVSDLKCKHCASESDSESEESLYDCKSNSSEESVTKSEPYVLLKLFKMKYMVNKKNQEFSSEMYQTFRKTIRELLYKQKVVGKDVRILFRDNSRKGELIGIIPIANTERRMRKLRTELERHIKGYSEYTTSLSDEELVNIVEKARKVSVKIAMSMES